MRTSTTLAIAVGGAIIVGVIASANPPEIKNTNPSSTETVAEPEPVNTPAVIPDETVTREQYMQLRLGASYEEVRRIMGTPGVEQSSSSPLGAPTTTVMTWGNPDGSSMMLTFQNGFLMAKNQYRLP